MRFTVSSEQWKDARRVNEARAQLRRKLNLSEQALQKELRPEAEQQVSSRPVRPGDLVLIKSMGVKATVTEAVLRGRSRPLSHWIGWVHSAKR